MFQGYFFSKPEVLQQKAIEPSFLTVIQLCSEVAQNEINYTDVERIVTQDVSLSYKLLRYVNSSITVSAEIKSFHQALVYLGQERLRKFVSLVAIATMRDNKPDSLYNLSLQRARLCELLLSSYDKNIDRSQAFLTGMFSLLDSLMDQPLEVIIESVPLDADIKNAILHGQGLLGQLLSLIIAYEKADWEQVNGLVEALGLNSDTVSSHFEEATLWADEVI
jgi:EAL and modified HD-GYP domain-containing signal transduction protein